jgi:hypothetical protein
MMTGMLKIRQLKNIYATSSSYPTSPLKKETRKKIIINKREGVQQGCLFSNHVNTLIVNIQFCRSARMTLLSGLERSIRTVPTLPVSNEKK